MAWTYSDWVTQAAAADRLTRLRLHIQEVSEKITLETASDGHSRSSASMQSYLDGLFQHERRLESVNGVPQTKFSAHRLRVG